MLLTKDKYDLFTCMFYEMWRRRCVWQTLPKNRIALRVNCPACHTAKLINRSIRSVDRPILLLDCLGFCVFCPIDFSYMEKSAEYDPAVRGCINRASRMIRYETAESPEEAVKIAEEVVRETRWKSYEELMKIALEYDSI